MGRRPSDAPTSAASCRGWNGSSRSKRREADAVGYETEPYDALLDEYEPGARGRDIDRLFAALGEELTALATGWPTRRVGRTPPFCGGSSRPTASAFSAKRRRRRSASTSTRGRLDATTHPFFTTVGPGDCRITTRYDRSDFSDAFFSTLHEVGHGLYEQGLDPCPIRPAGGRGPSLGVHESQSRLWENAVGRGLAFWRHFFPLARRVFPEALADVGLAEFHFAVNRVEPSLIRVRADEVTYDLHILARFELERALVSGDLRPADLPAAWDEAYRRRLGVAPADDAEGCLQDGHWAAGMIGYFPTYTLGNVIAAQLYARAEEDAGGLDAAFARGDFSPLLGWLREKVYRHGRALFGGAAGRTGDRRGAGPAVSGRGVAAEVWGIVWDRVRGESRPS